MEHPCQTGYTPIEWALNKHLPTMTELDHMPQCSYACPSVPTHPDGSRLVCGGQTCQPMFFRGRGLVAAAGAQLREVFCHCLGIRLPHAVILQERRCLHVLSSFSCSAVTTRNCKCTTILRFQQPLQRGPLKDRHSLGSYDCAT